MIARLLASIVTAAGLLTACGGSDDAPERGGAGADASGDGSGGTTDDGGAIAGAGGSGGGTPDGGRTDSGSGAREDAGGGAGGSGGNDPDLDGGSDSEGGAPDADAAMADSGGSDASTDPCAEDSDGCDADPDACVVDGASAAGFRCECPAGYDGDGVGADGCTEIDECGAAPCDADPAATCTDLLGAFACECPPGFAGDGVGTDGCLPRLIALATVPAGLAPAFDPEVASYELRVPLDASSVSLSPSVAAQVTLEIDGQVPASLPHALTLPLGTSDHTIEVSYGGTTTVYALTVTRGASVEAYIKAGDAGSSDEFGNSVSLDGDRLAIGAASEEAVGGQRGAVYVFEYDGGSWVETAKLEASNGDMGDNFGDSVSLDGDVLAVGAVGEDGDGSSPDNDDLTGSGAVYVFRHSGSGWTEEAYLKASNAGEGDHFGLSVSLSGNLLAVGAHFEDGDGLDPDDDSVLNSGAVYVFEYESSTWSEQAYLKADNPGASDYFGFSVSLDGNYLAVGAYMEDGDNVPPAGDDSLSDAGAVYVFLRGGGMWLPFAYLKPDVIGAADHFGYSVSLRGDLLAVGADFEWSDGSGPLNDSMPAAGAAYVFRRGGGGFIQEAYLKAHNAQGGDRFGIAVSIDGTRVAVSTPYEDSAGLDPRDNSAANAGAVYTYVYDGLQWVREAYLKPSHPDAGDQFGNAVSVSGGRIAVGAREEDGNGSSPDNDGATQAGAAYVFE